MADEFVCSTLREWGFEAYIDAFKGMTFCYIWQKRFLFLYLNVTVTICQKRAISPIALYRLSHKVVREKIP